MPVRYGIVCEKCRKLHFALDRGKTGRVRYDKTRDEFTLTCIPPCTNIIYFNKRMLMPFVVPDESVKRGYADVDACRPVAARG